MSNDLRNRARRVQFGAEPAQADNLADNGAEKADVPKRLALAAADGGALDLGNFRLTKVGLDVAGKVTQEQWENVGKLIQRIDTSIQWLIGDWMAYGERTWGRTYEEVAAMTGYEIKTLYNYAWVASHVEISLRKENLAFGHHNLVASLESDQQREWLEYAAENNLSVAQMRKAMVGEQPALQSPHAYDRLFSREHKPSLNSLENLFLKAGQGDQKAREKAFKTLDDLARWVDEARRSL